MDPLTPNTNSSQSNSEGVRSLKVLDKDLVIQGLQQILRDLPEIEWSRLSDSIKKNSVIVLSKEYGASLDNFPPGAVVEDPSPIASKVSGISESFNTTNNHNVTASGEHSFAAGKVVIKIYVGEKSAQSPIGPDSTPIDPVLSASEVKAALRALYTSENFKTIKRLVDPTKSLSIAESFIRLAVVLEKDFERAQKEVLDGKKGDSTKNSDFVYLNSHEAIMQPKKLIEVGELFEYSALDKLTPSRLLAVGAAGVGKSTLCQYLANTWAEHPEKLGDWKSKFDYLFLIRLRDLASYPSLPTLAEVVQKSLRGLSVESIESILSKCGDKILFLLDGYDEVASWLSQNEERNAFFRELLRQPHWILTTRPNYFNESMSSYNCRKLEITGFTRSDIKKYINRFFKDSSCPERAPLVHQLLTSNTRIAAMSHIPINLELLCSVWKMKRTTSAEPYTMTKLYGEISGFLFRRYIRDRLGSNSQGVTLNFISENEQYRPFLQAIETIAWKGLMSRTASLIIDREIYEPVIRPILNSRQMPASLKTNFYSAFFNDLGFFRSVPSFENSENPDLADYYFIHLTFQEYFAARYFVRKYFHPDVQGEEWKERLNDMKFNPKFGVVLWFVAGLLGERLHDCSDSRNAEKEAKGALDAFIKCLMSQPRSLLGSHELALAMHCSEELEGVSVASQQEVLEEFVVMLRNFDSGGIRELRKKSCVTLFQGIRKFYLMDTEQNILHTIQKGDFDRASGLVVVFHLLAPGVIDFLIKKMEDQQEDRSVLFTATLTLFFLQMDGAKLGKVAEVVIQRIWYDGLIVPVEFREKIRLEGETLGMVAHVLIQALEDDDKDTRAIAAKSLGKLQLEGETLAKVVEALIQRLGDKYSSVRRAAAISLGKLQLEGETLAKVVEVLIQRLEDEHRDVRSAAAKSLGQFQIEGELLAKVVEVLIQRLEDEHRDVRSAAAKSLGQFQIEGELLAKVVEVLIQRLEDEHRDVRSAAAESLGQLHLEGEKFGKVAELLIQRLGDDHSYVRKAAAKSLGQLHLEGETIGKVVEALIQRLGDEDSDVLRTAAESIGQLHLEGEKLGKVAELLIQRLGDDDSYVRMAAVELLGKLQLDGETLGRVAEALIQRLGDDGSNVRMAAVELLPKLEPKGEALWKAAEALILRLEDEDSAVRSAAAESLGQLHLEGEKFGKVAELLIQRLGDDHSYVRKAAAASLGELHLEGEKLGKVAEALTQRLGDDDSYVRSTAAKSLVQFQIDGETLGEVAEILIQGLWVEKFLAQFFVSGFFQTLIDIKKTCAQIKSNKKAAIKLIAYKVFLSETLCYYREGCFYYYDQGRLSEPIEMDEDDYRKLERFLKTELLAIDESNNPSDENGKD